MKTDNSHRRGLMNRYFGLLERRKRSDRLFLQIALAAFVVSLIYAAFTYSEQKAVPLPGSGGTLVEGIVGTPRFVNPVLATTKADKDMVALVYSGLMKVSERGELVPDLAESIELSEDGQTYTIKLRNNAYFHNGSPVLAKDVAYTIALIQNPDLKSPLRGNWEGVLVAELGDRELNVVIKEPYAPFIENFTVGIIPREIWDELPTEQLPFSQNNTNPVGSGLYQIENITYNQSGLIESYLLRAAQNYQETPNITNIEINFFANEEDLLTALDEGEIMSTASLSSHNLDKVNDKKFAIVENPLPRTFALYFNQNKAEVLRNRAVREALATAIDKEELINEILSGHAIVTDCPIPAGFFTKNSTSTPEEFDRLTKARSILTEAGWAQKEDGTWFVAEDEVETELIVTISTANTQLFDITSNHIAKTWQELGVKVNVDQYEQTDLVQAIIRPRDFQILLFGADIGRSTDLYPFWHSSQKSDPGLNIAQYTNIEADALLEEIRVATSTEAKQAITTEVLDLIENDSPAIFLYTPTFGYVYDKNVSLNIYSRISSQHERFADIGSWYITTEKIWPVFRDKKINQ